MSDLARKMDSNILLDFDSISVTSYENGTESTGNVRITKDLEYDPRGKHILLVEDIVDTGYTLDFLRNHILSKSPASYKVCAFLDKPERRLIPDIEADYLGFVIPDKFVVGYGMDYKQFYRNLPYLGVLEFLELE